MFGIGGLRDSELRCLSETGLKFGLLNTCRKVKLKDLRQRSLCYIVWGSPCILLVPGRPCFHQIDKIVVFLESKTIANIMILSQIAQKKL